MKNRNKDNVESNKNWETRSEDAWGRNRDWDSRRISDLDYRRRESDDTSYGGPGRGERNFDRYGTRGGGDFYSSGPFNNFDRSEYPYAPRFSNERGQFFGKGPKGYTRSDERIKEDVSEALMRHGEIDASEVEVEVRDGEVTLSGTVENRAMKRLVEDVIDEVFGVKEVHNQLRSNSGSYSRETSKFPENKSRGDKNRVA